MCIRDASYHSRVGEIDEAVYDLDLAYNFIPEELLSKLPGRPEPYVQDAVAEVTPNYIDAQSMMKRHGAIANHLTARDYEKVVIFQGTDQAQKAVSEYTRIIVNVLGKANLWVKAGGSVVPTADRALEKPMPRLEKLPASLPRV